MAESIWLIGLIQYLLILLAFPVQFKGHSLFIQQLVT